MVDVSTPNSPAARPDASKRPRTRYVLNLRLLTITLVVAAVVGGIAHVWHGRQMRVLAGAWKDGAIAQEAEGEYDEAVRQWQQYLYVHPDDVEARVRLAQSLGKQARASAQPGLVEQAVKAYYATVGVAPAESRGALRAELAELLLAQFRFTETLEQADLILKDAPGDSEAKRLRALALYGQFHTGGPAIRAGFGAKVSLALREALAAKPADVHLARTLAEIHRARPELLPEEEQNWDEKRRNEAADAVMDQMVAANANSAEAHLARYGYRVQFRLPNADADLASALEHGQDNPTVRMLAGGNALRAGKLGQARGKDPKTVEKHFAEAHEHFQSVVDRLAPRQANAYLMLGETEMSQGKTSDALAAWQRGAKEAAGDPQVRILHCRLAEVLMDRGEVGQVEQHLDAVHKINEQIVARQPADRARAVRISLDRVETLLRARWLQTKGDTAGAVPLLEDLVRDTDGPREETTQAWRLLGQCRMALGQPREAAEAFDRVLLAVPEAVGVRLAAADAWRLAGQPDTAATYYRQVLRAAPEGSALRRPDVWLSLAMSLFDQQRALPPKEQRWDEFEQALAAAKTPQPAFPLKAAWQVPVLESNFALLRAHLAGRGESGVDQALAILRNSEELGGQSPEHMANLVIRYESLGKPADADRALQRFEKAANDPAAACLLRARLHVLRKEPAKARAALEAGLVKASPKRRTPILFALTSLDLIEGKPKDAAEKLRRIHAEDPNNVGAIQQLAHLAWTLEEFDEGRQWEDKLLQLKGSGDPVWQYFRVRRLFHENENPTGGQLAEIERLVTNLTETRPNWSCTQLVRGLLLEKQSQLTAAIDAYQKAVKLGAGHLGVQRRLVHLLYRAERFDEAQQCLARLGAEVPKEYDLSGVQIELARRQGEIGQALELARQGVDARPNDIFARIWLGQMLVANGKTAEAEAVFAKAVELDPKNVVPRDVLWRYHLTTGDLAEARATLQGLVDNVAMSDARRSLVLAVGHEQLAACESGKDAQADRAKALTFFREAVQRSPGDAIANLGLAKMLMPTDPAGAEAVLRQFLKASPDNRSARWALAELLTNRGGEANWREAERLASDSGQNANGQGDQGKDIGGIGRRVEAQLLLRRGGRENLDKAKQLIQDAIRTSSPARPEDRLLLAQLHEATGDVGAAKQQYIALLDPARPNNLCLQGYVGLLLRQGERDEAGKWLKRLVEAAPDELPTVRLQARLLKQLGQTDKIEPLLRQAAEKSTERLEKLSSADAKKGAEAELMAGLGMICTESGLHPAAEGWYRRLVEIAPRGYPLLAGSLARQGRLKEAIALCDKAAESDASIRPAVALAGVLAAGKPAAADFAAAEPLLDKTRKAHPTDAAFLFSLATVRILQERLDDAEAVYGEVLKQAPNDPMALNNLATVLTEMPGRRNEALERIDQAIAHSGPQPALLDTKAVLLLLEGKSDEAVALLEDAVAGLKDDPRFDFHLALAYDRSGDAAKAQEALRRAEGRDLGDQVLTRTERTLLDELKRKLGR